MKVLVVNGSPSGERGKTWWVAKRFVDGMKDAKAEVTIVHLQGKKIHHCTGELACWLKTPGKCIHKDDMDFILPFFYEVEAVVLASPVYVDGMTGLLKNFVDRLVPTVEPFFEIRNGHIRHPARNTKISRVALVSVCGFPEMDNFDPIVHHVRAICRNMNAKFAGAVLRPAAPALDAAKIFHPFKTWDVSGAIKKAGIEFVQDGEISDETAATAAMEIFSAEDYKREANKSFEKALKRIEEKKK